MRRRRSRLEQAREAVEEHSALLLTAILSLVIIGSLLAVGTVHTQTLLVIAPLPIVGAAIAIWVERDSTSRFPPAAAVTAALAVYSLLQSAPLPLHWVRKLSPIAAQSWVDAYQLASVTSLKWVSLSVDPGASRTEALKWLTYASVFIVAARLAREKGHRRGLVIVVAAAVVGGLLSILHGLAGIDDWMLLYRPLYAAKQWAPAPLLNPNNFAGYLNLALFAAMGLLFARTRVISRWLIAATIALLASLVILTGSRGGVLALVVGFAAAGLAFQAQQRRAALRGARVLPPWVPLLTLAIAACGLAAIGANDNVWQQLLDETTGKLRIIEYSQQILRDHLWLGTGRGAFGTAYAAYRRELGDHIAHYPENFVVQWLVEWGLPVTFAGFAGLLLTLRPHRSGFGVHSAQTAVYLSVGILLLQNFVDLATEIPSVAIAAFALLGTAQGTASRAHHKHHTQPPQSKRHAQTVAPTALAVAFLLPTSALIILVAKTAVPDVIGARSQLSEDYAAWSSMRRDPASGKALKSRIASNLLRFPSDPYFPLIGALLSVDTGQSPLAWLNHALRRDPLSARPHFLLADALAKMGAKNQALLEVRTAAKLHPPFVPPLADRVLRWARAYEDLQRAVPDGIDGIAMLNALAQRTRSTEQRQQLLGESLRRDERNVGTNATIAFYLLADLNAKNGTCAQSGRMPCEATLRKHVAIVDADTKNSLVSVLLHAQVLAYENKLEEAEAWLAERCGKVTEPQACHQLRVEYASRLAQPERYDEATVSYIAAACTTQASCANAHNWLGHLELGRNRPLMALSRFERAAEEQPTAAAWLKVAELAETTGRLNRAYTAVAAAKRLGGTAKVDELEKRLTVLRRNQMLRELAQ